VRRTLAVYEESAEVNRKLGTPIPPRLKGEVLKTRELERKTHSSEKKETGFDFNYVAACRRSTIYSKCLKALA
jgi:hypothetical protein